MLTERKSEWLSRVASKYRVVLVEPTYQINIGYVARCMKNFGFRDLVLVKPRVHMLSEAAIFSAHARDLLLKYCWVVDDLEEALTGIDLVVGTTGKIPRGYDPLRAYLTPREFAEKARDYNGNIALLFGREDIGLKNTELEVCDLVVHVPANPKYPILNLSHAVAIILYEIFIGERSKYGKGVDGRKIPRRSEMKILLQYFSEILEKTGYPASRRRRAELTFRRVIARSMISKEELYAFMGFFRKILVRVRQVDEA